MLPAMRRRRTILILVASVLPPGLSLGACSEATGVLWEDAGERQELVVALVVGGPITGADTLPVVATGFSTAGRPSRCRWEATRTEHQADLLLWVRAERWIGAGEPPPYDLQFHCAFLVRPPLSAGIFRVVLHQADGSTLTDSVTVQAPASTLGAPVPLDQGE
jgi:hypothetical protein